MAGELEAQVAEGLIGPLAQRDTHEFFERELFGLLLLAFKQQLANGGQVFRGARARVIVRLANPERGFVELNALFCNAAKNHRTQPAIADGNSLDPLRGRPVVPETQRLFGRKRLTAEFSLRCEWVGNCPEDDCNREANTFAAESALMCIHFAGAGVW